MSSVPCSSSIRFLYWFFSLIDVDTLLALDVGCLRPRSGGAPHRILCFSHKPSVQYRTPHCLPTPAEPASAAPGELAPAVLIDLLLDVIRHPEHDVKAVCRQLASLGHWSTPDQLEGVFRNYGLKKLCAPARGARRVMVCHQLSPRKPSTAGKGARRGFGCGARTCCLS